MKPVRGDLIALLAVVVLALVGQREATASPCKADGEACRTSRSCCGTSGNNGICVRGDSRVGFGTCCTPSGAEVCDGRDNDCNGAVDENLGTTTCGVGACTRTVDNCVGGVPQTCTPGTPTTETCNGIDDDCDGAVDEGLGSTTCGTGACARTVQNCVGGVPQSCDPAATDGKPCDDGEACTENDTCESGVCAGSNVPDGTTCDDGSFMTTVDVCTMGACGGCVPAGDCSTAATACAFNEYCPFGETCDFATVPSPRFVSNGDGTVTDRKTCLVWEKKTGTVGTVVFCSTSTTCPDPQDVNNTYQWSSTVPQMDGGAFTDFLAKLNAGTGFAGHIDWRLPKSGGRPEFILGTGEPAELESILDFSQGFCGGGSGPCIDPIFGPTAASFYWSSSTAAPALSVAWGVNFGNGGSSTFPPGGVGTISKPGFIFVRAVRGGR